MRPVLFGLGYLLAAAGAMLVCANVVLSFLGLGASYNLGDPSEFEFILVPFWQIGAGLLVLGLIAILAARRLAGRGVTEPEQAPR